MSKVLVIDDDDSILEATRAVLEMEGHNVIARSDAHDVMDVLEEHQPDLVILDVLLQNQMGGNDLCKTIKASKEYRHIPLILFSASIHLSTVAHECGADDYLPKPFDIDQLTRLVDKWAK